VGKFVASVVVMIVGAGSFVWSAEASADRMKRAHDLMSSGRTIRGWSSARAFRCGCSLMIGPGRSPDSRALAT